MRSADSLTGLSRENGSQQDVRGALCSAAGPVRTSAISWTLIGWPGPAASAPFKHLGSWVIPLPSQGATDRAGRCNVAGVLRGASEASVARRTACNGARALWEVQDGGLGVQHVRQASPSGHLWGSAGWTRLRSRPRGKLLSRVWRSHTRPRSVGPSQGVASCAWQPAFGLGSTAAPLCQAVPCCSSSLSTAEEQPETAHCSPACWPNPKSLTPDFPVRNLHVEVRSTSRSSHLQSLLSIRACSRHSDKLAGVARFTRGTVLHILVTGNDDTPLAARRSVPGEGFRDPS